MGSVGAAAKDHGRAGVCRNPDITADGRFVAFETDARNMAAEFVNPAAWLEQVQIYVRDITTNTTRCASILQSAIGCYHCNYPSISDDGRFVAYSTYSDNLTFRVFDVGLNPPVMDILVHDMRTSYNVHASMSTDRQGGNGDSDRPALSRDGRYVAFTSVATNFVSGDAPFSTDVFLRGPLAAPGRVFPAGDKVYSSPTAVDGTVYSGCDDGKLCAVRTADGTAVPGFPVDVSARPGVPVRLRGCPSVYVTDPDGPEGSEMPALNRATSSLDPTFGTGRRRDDR